MSDRRKQTPHITLRPARPVDIPFVVSLLRDDQVRHFLGGCPDENSLHRTASGLICAQQGEIIRLVEADNGTPLGLISLTHHKDGKDVELSYQFAPQHWGKGHAFTACRALLQYGFQTLQLPQIIAETQTANTRSMRLLTRLGFVETGQIIRFGAHQSLMRLTSS